VDFTGMALRTWQFKEIDGTVCDSGSDRGWLLFSSEALQGKLLCAEITDGGERTVNGRSDFCN
jgi:hypothetical protein